MINQKTRKCLVWGIGKEYDSYTNQIHFEILKENIDIIAYVSRDLYCREFEGKPVIYPNDNIFKIMILNILSFAIQHVFRKYVDRHRSMGFH